MDYYDTNGTPIIIGCTIEHTGHGDRYKVVEPGTERYLCSHNGPILIPETAKHQLAFKLTELRASKARVVA